MLEDRKVIVGDFGFCIFTEPNTNKSAIYDAEVVEILDNHKIKVKIKGDFNIFNQNENFKIYDIPTIDFFSTFMEAMSNFFIGMTTSMERMAQKLGEMKCKSEKEQRVLYNFFHHAVEEDSIIGQELDRLVDILKN